MIKKLIFAIVLALFSLPATAEEDKTGFYFFADTTLSGNLTETQPDVLGKSDWEEQNFGIKYLQDFGNAEFFAEWRKRETDDGNGRLIRGTGTFTPAKNEYQTVAIGFQYHLKVNLFNR